MSEKYIPFKTVKEYLEECSKRGALPFIVKEKLKWKREYSASYRTIVSCNDYECLVAGYKDIMNLNIVKSYNFKKMLEDYCFSDGSPFGKLDRKTYKIHELEKDKRYRSDYVSHGKSGTMYVKYHEDKMFSCLHSTTPEGTILCPIKIVQELFDLDFYEC